ncbi:aspartate kinase [Candidatus Uhrbacteria bacterium]|nr:aspartate kinase [Candidatus Uhrbacteria bacterium]
MKILKFGGTSVGTPESIRKVIEIVRAAAADESCVVVVSAFTKVTDKLIDVCEASALGGDYQASLQELERRHVEAVSELISFADQSSLVAEVKASCNELADILRGLSLLGELTPRARDLVMSFGERLSATVIAAALKGGGLPATLLDARECIKTDSQYGHAQVLFAETVSLVRRYFHERRSVTVVTGFIASTIDGHTTTLGRGGSDYTASILGAALDASAIEIWTDVDGVMTADPRIVPQARRIRKTTYEETMELSYFGAKVIYYPTIIPAREHHIPLVIKNTFNPDALGTNIGDEPSSDHSPVTAITSVAPIVLLQIKGVGLIGTKGMARRVFGALADATINVILISQASSEYSICIAIAAHEKDHALATLASEFELEIIQKRIDPICAENESAIIAVVGARMRETPGTVGRVFSAVGSRKINVRAIAQGSSELNISFVVSESDKEEAIRAIHDEFFV